MIRPLLAFLMIASAAHAADLSVLTAGAYRGVLNDLVPAIEKATGHHLLVTNETTGVLVQKLKAGARPDLVILPPSAAAELGALLGPARPVAKVGIGVAMAKGAPIPDISTEAGLRAVALASRAPTWIDPKAGGSSGIYMASLWEKWGIAAPMSAKAVLAQGGLAADKIVGGQADVAFQQISELMAVSGVVVAGPLPASVQSYTVYAGAVPASSVRQAAANQVLAILAAPGANAILRQHGMEAP